MPLANFTLSVDTFFFIRSVVTMCNVPLSNVLTYNLLYKSSTTSGLLLIFSNWKKLQLTNGTLNVLDFFFHRIWRIWPAYAATIGIAIVLPVIGSGPLWPAAVESAADTCRNSWWTNLLFVNNFLDADKVCLFHTWFLSASMQFHLAGGFILYVMYRYECGGAMH